MTCPWLVRLTRSCNAKVTILQCTARATRNGTSALAKISVPPGCTLNQIVREIRRVNSIDSCTFTALKPSVFLGIVATKACPCIAALLPYHHIVRVTSESEDRLRFTLFFDKSASIKKLLTHLEKQGIDIRIEEVGRSNYVWTLTERQEERLRAALELGFYDVPKKIRLRNLSELFHVSPRAICEILRRGERRLIVQALRFAMRQ